MTSHADHPFAISGRDFLKSPSLKDRAHSLKVARSHSRLVSILRIALPILALCVLGLYFISPKLHISIGNMDASVASVVIDKGNLRMLNPRLEGANKAYHTAVLVTSATQKLAAEEFVFREVDQVRVKGREKPERIYELLGPKGHEPGFDLSLYATALQRYREGDFAGAREPLEQLLESCPDDGPSRVLLERIEQLSPDGPPPDWDGVWTMTAK